MDKLVIRLAGAEYSTAQSGTTLDTPDRGFAIYSILLSAAASCSVELDDQDGNPILDKINIAAGTTVLNFSGGALWVDPGTTIKVTSSGAFNITVLGT